ncbi:MAG: right-handed parallel beta-helix repeat-containing protein [Planctomycetota bacterium]
MKKKVRNWFVLSIFLLTIVAAANTKTIYVDADVSAGGGGTNWADAYKYLQDGLADANTSAKPVEIRVAQGTYKPDEGVGVSDGDREATFQLINGVTLKGGYAGDGEPDPDARDIANYVSILSGDLDGNDVPVATGDLLTEPTRAENSCHVVSANDVDANAVFNGFTVTAGNADGSWASNQGTGGGICNLQGSPTVFDCVLTNNSANWGGGMFSDGVGSEPTLTNCMFSYNFSSGTGGGMCNGAGSTMLLNCTFIENVADYAGGGIYDSGGIIILDNCTFTGNSATNHGGAFRKPPGGDVILSNCMFSNNSAGDEGGGMHISGGGDRIVSNCTFMGNSSNDGGGMYIVLCKLTLINCAFNGNSASNNGGGIFTIEVADRSAIVTNCSFSGNTASIDGGASGGSHCFATFTNCTFSENSAGGDGGGFCISLNGGTPDFNNCIFWGNTANNEGPQIAIKSSFATVDVNYCDVQGGDWDIYVSAGTLNYDVSNIDSNPLFVDADGADDTAGTEDDNLRLTNGSPCIDAGDNTAVPADTADLDGDGNTVEPTPIALNSFARFIDDLCTADTGNPGAPGPIVDMGAYEFLRSDIDSDGSVDFEDYCVIGERWRQTSCGLCGGADLTCDGEVNAYDLKELADNWLW